MASTSEKPLNTAPDHRSTIPRYGTVLDGIVIAVGTALITLLLAVVPGPMGHWRYLLQHLYYVPPVYAGLRHGWPGGVAVAVLGAFCFATQVQAPDQYWEIPIFSVAGLFCGLAAERERKRKRASEETTRRLASINKELQENVEQMKRAERLYALGQLSAGLAHEIRNPLASIAGATGILRRGQASPAKMAECVEIIHKECQRLSRMLTSFLDFARPRSPNFVNTSLETVFDSVLGLAEHAVDGSRITFRREDPCDLTLESDPEQLKQVLLNLVINAIQAMPNGGEVVLASRTVDGDAIIEVRDQGCGVSEKEMEHLYDPFFTTKENGTGLGLPVAHQIVAHLGGILSARNNPDRGMTFTVALPLHHRMLP
ncbi:MAG: ATP-binding protein [Acidobacteria bacterium]|nr:ATP-binding protein [Acidobacteriota bacterium]